MKHPRFLSICRPLFTAMVLVLALAALQSFVHAAGVPDQRQGLTTKHVVSEAELRSSVKACTAERGASLGKITSLLDSDAARRALAKWGIKPDRIKAAVSTLSDEELAFLAARADGVMADLQGGEMSRLTMALILAGIILAAMALGLALGAG